MAVRRLNRRRIGGGAAPMVSASLITATAPKTTIPQSQTATPAARAAQTDFARQADGINTARIMRNADGGFSAESGFGNGAKKYGNEQIKWIMSRGASGGGLSKQDQAVYDRMMYLRAQETAQQQQDAAEKRALDAAHAEDDRKRRLDAAEWDRQNAVRQEQQQAAAKQAQEAQIAEEMRRNEEYDRRTKAEQDYKAQQQQAALDAENAKYEALNKRYGIAEGTRLTDRDYSDLAAGRSKWGYSRTDQQAIDTIRSDFETADRNNIYSKDRYFVNTSGGLKRVDGPDVEGADTEYNFARKAMEDKIASFRKRLLPNDAEPTAEQIYNGAFTAPDGTRLIPNGNGGLAAIPGTGPQKEVETPEQKLDTKMKDYLLKEVGNARKEWETAVSQGKIDIESKEILNPSNENGAPLMIPNPNFGKTFDEAAALKAARNNWNAVFGAPSAPSVQTAQPPVAGVTPQPATPTATPTNDPRKKWSQFAD